MSITFDNIKNELRAIVGTEYKMTKDNHDKLHVLKDKIKNLFGQESIHPNSITQLLLITYDNLNKIEKYYREHNYKWEEPV